MVRVQQSALITSTLDNRSVAYLSTVRQNIIMFSSHLFYGGDKIWPLSPSRTTLSK